MLTRAVRTANLALEEMGLSYLPVRRHWRLNERHYGALQGGNKKEAAAKFGAEQVKLWRRSYATPPPALEIDDPRHPSHDPRYANIAPGALPATECLADVVVRVVPYWEDVIGPELLSGVTPFIVAHGNSIRAFTMFLEHISEDDIVGLRSRPGGRGLSPLMTASTLSKAVTSVILLLSRPRLRQSPHRPVRSPPDSRRHGAETAVRARQYLEMSRSLIRQRSSNQAQTEEFVAITSGALTERSPARYCLARTGPMDRA